MPRSRNSRSASPQKSASAESLAEFERNKIYQNVHDIFCEAVDDDVIRLVLQECHFKEELCIEKLLMIAESREEQKKYKSRLHSIAEGVFGSLRSQDHGQNTIPTASNLSPSEKVIRRPTKTGTNDTGSPMLHKALASDPQLHARGTGPSFYLPVVPPTSSISPDEIEMDLHFPQLPTKSPDAHLSSRSSSISSARSRNELSKSDPSKSALLSQAQSAYSQQYDDAEGSQRWEQYKEKLSEHYLVNITKDNEESASKSQNLDSAIKTSSARNTPVMPTDLASPRSDSLERSRSASGRSFPVRLLSRSPETVLKEEKMPGLISGQNDIFQRKINEISAGTLDSSDLDETVLKCIYQVHGDLLDEKELKRKAQNEEKTTETPSNRPSSQPMTLPTIGLSVDAVEFVPKAKPAVSTIQEEIVTTTVVDTIPQPTSKTTRSNSVEINSGVKNIRNNSPSVQVVSPLTISPSLSPGVGLSPPSTMMNSPVANLTGSPMFITPKWGQLYHTVNRPPPLLATPGTRFMGPNPSHHLQPAGFRFTAPGPMPYSSRVLPVYTVAPPPLFRMAGVQQFVQHPNVQFTDSIEERVAVATGQPIMATSEASRLIAPSAVVPKVKVPNQDKIEKLQLIQQSGLKVLVIVRGLPGSGKSTLARALQLTGLVLSTDDYFTTGNVYEFNPDKLAEAHQWNRERTREAMKMGKSPIIIDNTNTQVWEFKPYINLALTFNYHIEIFEPDTPWKYNCSELARRTLHGVPQDHIQRMCDRYEHNITVEQIIKKRKSESRLNGSSDDLEAVPEKPMSVKMEKTLPQTQDDPSKQTITANETRNSKDVLRLQTYKGDDLKKQKSAESDSDSICSFHSGSLSNQSSRNASPKPLRPSLKPPGALQKMEKLKPSLATKPLALKPSVLKRKRKEIKELESKLSEETLQIVEDVVTEHVKDKIVSVSDIKKLEEELKALLQLLIANNSEIEAGEKLISLKLEVLNQNSEISEDSIISDNPDIEEDKEESLECKSSHEDDIKLGNGKVTPENGQDLEVELKLTSDKDVHNLEINSDINENHQVTNSASLLNNTFNNEISEEPVNTEELISKKKLSETKLSSWKEIAIVRNDEGSKHDADTEGLLSYASDSIDRSSASASGLKCAFFLGDTRPDLTVNDFELKYWGIVPTDMPEDGVQNEIIQNTWEDVSESCWSEPAEKSAKPQRKKRNKSSDTSLEASVAQTNGESVNVEEPNPDSHLTNEFEVFDGSNEIDEEISNILSTQYGKCNENDARPVVQEFPNEGKPTGCAGTQETCEIIGNQDNGDQILETVCSNLEEISEVNSDTLEARSQIIVSSALNNSLKLLQDSYIESENPIQSSAKLPELNMERKTIDNEEQSEKLDDNTMVNSKIKACEANKLTEKSGLVKSLHCNKSSNINCNIGIESNTTEGFTASVTLAKKIQEIRSSESLTTSEDSEIDGSVKSESDIEGTPLSSPQSSFYKKPSNQNGKKTGKRKMAANFKGPFLNEDDKEKFKTTSWSSFPIHGIEQITSSPSSSKGSLKTNINSVETMTEVECFNCVTSLNQGEFIDSSVRYLTGNPRKMFNGFHKEPDKVNQEVTDILNVDKSTSTDDFVTLTDKESVEFLQTCFPKLPVEELECVLENCANNVEWAINLLLDWKYDLRLSAEEKQKFAEGMAELKRCSSPENVEVETETKGPKSLLDICFDYIERKEIATREDIERQLIQTGKERLDRIEDDNMTKIRLHRSTSLTDTSVNLKSSPGENNLPVFRSRSRPGKDLENTRFSESLISKLLEYKVDGLNENQIEQVPINNQKEVDSVENNTDIEMNNIDSETDISISNNVEGLEACLDWMMKPAMTMAVDSEAIRNLEELFGPIGHKDDLKESLLVPLDRKTAWLMYQSVKRGIVDQRALQRREQQQLREDEEYARQLQEAENAESRYRARTQKSGSAQPGSPYKKSTPLIGLSVQGTIPKEQEKIAWNGRNQSLAQIMKEEKQIQEKAEEFERLIRLEGGDKQMATCLKRQKLYGKFPKLDKNLLNDIFKANCFNLTETVASIEMSLAVDKPGKVSDTAALSDFTNDDQLMEATKQQSMQEMLDSYIYHPVISKDYQDGTELEYEDLRGEANLHFRLRNECFHKAREAYRRGLKQVATFYSQQGHQHTQKIKEANMRASDQILAERNVDIDKNLTLDLHGLHVDEAIAALNRIIPQKERERCKHITVMTGRGSHSRGGISRLRPAVLGYLKSSKYNYTELQTGVFKVSLKYRTPER